MTNYIDTLPGFGQQWYYRVAAFRGSAFSAYSNVSITPFHLPTALAISWMENVPGQYRTNPISNSRPPSQFLPDLSDMASYLITEDYRDFLGTEVSISVDPYTGEIINPRQESIQFVGYTNIGPVHISGEGQMATSGPSFNVNHTAINFLTLAKFRLNPIENWGATVLNNFNRLPWAWAAISYTVDANGAYNIQFLGSVIPSQSDYINGSETVGYRMSANPNSLSSFYTVPFGSLAPRDNR